MKKFKFKLATVLTTRRIREDLALRTLGLYEKSYIQEKDKKQVLMKRLDEALKRVESFGESTSLPGVLHSEVDFVTGLRQRLVQADHAILKAKKNVDRSMQIYLNCKAQTGAIEKLEEGAYSEFKRQVQKAEQKVLDEIVAVNRSRLGHD